MNYKRYKNIVITRHLDHIEGYKIICLINGHMTKYEEYDMSVEDLRVRSRTQVEKKPRVPSVEPFSFVSFEKQE